MNIRFADINDIDKIILLEDQIFMLHLNARPDWIDENKKPRNYKYLKNCITNNECKIIIVEENENIIGSCIFKHRKIKDHIIFKDMNNIEIDELIIDKKYRRKGIGKIIFKKIIEFAKENDINKIELGVWAFNKGAIEFYKNMGMNERHIKMEINIK
jgi:ribosomal protein S18 acetylase RimI-like enzyme